jgi:hypothetical protein
MEVAGSVQIDQGECMDKFARRLVDDLIKKRAKNEGACGVGEEYVDWDECGWHYCEDREDKGGDGHLTVQYIFVLDALNWCFWPTDNFEYEQLAVSLKQVLISTPDAFDAKKLAELTEQELESWFLPLQIPMADERVQKINELGVGLMNKYDGLAINLVKQANNSATMLVDLVVDSFPGFRDHSVYKGRQVFFYKRAQILVGDVWAAFGRKSIVDLQSSSRQHHPCTFYDMSQLTMFADYRVPQLLREENILVYLGSLASKIDKKIPIPVGSEEEIEIRAATVQAVEFLNARCIALGLEITSVELDWYLWQTGEHRLATMRPHHRTLTVYY